MIRSILRTGAFVLALLPTHFALAQDATPVVNDDFYNTREDSSVTVAAPGLFENDELTDDSLLVVLVSPPANGSVEVGQDGSFQYTPNIGFNGVDSFSYLIETVPKQVLSVDTSQSSFEF